MINPINDRERAWIASLLDELSERDVALDLRSIEGYYDAMVRDWYARPADQRWNPTDFLARVGAAFGACLSRRTGLDWYVVRSGAKESIALMAADSEFVIYPLAVIAKRWRAGHTGFIAGLGEEFISAVQNFAARPVAEAEVEFAEQELVAA